MAILLVRAIRATFERRKTPLPVGPPVALTLAFADDATKHIQWSGFARKSSARDVVDLPAAVVAIVAFAERPLAAAASGALFEKRWLPGGPWLAL
jgi:hypothetical protein